MQIVRVAAASKIVVTEKNKVVSRNDSLCHLTPIKPARSTDKKHPGRKGFSFPFNDRPARLSGLISLGSSDGWASG
jgi:hypothetical protein